MTTKAKARKPARRRLDPVERARWADKFAKRYAEGATVRQIEAETGWSYGLVHRLLVDHPDVTMRPRGGPGTGAVR